MFFEPLCFLQNRAFTNLQFCFKKIKYTVEEIFHKKRKVLSVKTNRRQLLRKTLGEMVATNEHKSRKVKNKNKRYDRPRYFH